MARSSSGITGAFYDVDEATLTSLLTQYTACLVAIATAGQSYTIQGRQYNRAQLPEVRDTIAELKAALNRANNTGTTQTFARFAP